MAVIHRHRDHENVTICHKVKVDLIHNEKEKQKVIFKSYNGPKTVKLKNIKNRNVEFLEVKNQLHRCSKTMKGLAISKHQYDLFHACTKKHNFSCKDAIQRVLMHTEEKKEENQRIRNRALERERIKSDNRF